GNNAPRKKKPKLQTAETENSELNNISRDIDIHVLEAELSPDAVTAPKINIIDDLGKQKEPVRFTILQDLRERIESLPEFIPVGTQNGRLSQYSGDVHKLTEDIINDNELWELRWDSEFNNLLPSEDPVSIHGLVLREPYGLIGVVNVMEHLVRDRSIAEFLLTGKIERLLKAIDEVCAAYDVAPKTPPPTNDIASPSVPVILSGTAVVASPSADKQLGSSKPVISDPTKTTDKPKVWKWKISNFISPRNEAECAWQEQQSPGPKKFFDAEWTNVISKDSVLMQKYQMLADKRRGEAKKANPLTAAKKGTKTEKNYIWVCHGAKWEPSESYEVAYGCRGRTAG
ncbi:hypothetical protein V5O48_014551, partial [Marasmius crinis-equi]